MKNLSDIDKNQLDGERREPTEAENQYHQFGVVAIDARYGFDQKSAEEALDSVREVVDEIRQRTAEDLRRGVLTGISERVRSFHQA